VRRQQSTTGECDPRSNYDDRSSQWRATQLLISAATPEGKQAGLIKDSVITCENLATVLQTRITRRIGSLPADAMLKIDECLKSSLGIA
jgi:mRNA-degrading endonuclease toxin of MazEF toxin-antitoxin module